MLQQIIFQSLRSDICLSIAIISIRMEKKEYNLGIINYHLKIKLINK